MASNLSVDLAGIPFFQEGVDSHIAGRDSAGHPILTTDRTAEQYWARQKGGAIYLMALPVGPTWLADGAYLDDPDGRWFVNDATTWPSGAARRVSTLELPRRNGVTVRKQGWGTGTVKLGFYVHGDSVELHDPNLGALESLLARAGTLTFRNSDRTRSADIVKVELSDPEILSDPRWSKLEATVTTQPFWQGADIVTSADQVMTVGVLAFTEWAGCTGPVSDAVLRLRGPFDQLVLTGSNGSSLRVLNAVSAGSFIFVDLASFSAWSGAAGQWSPSAATVAIDYGPGGPLQFEPTSRGEFALTIAATGLTASSAIAVRGRKWWL